MFDRYVETRLDLAPDALPLARQLASEVLSLPMGPHLAPEDASAVARACG